MRSVRRVAVVGLLLVVVAGCGSDNSDHVKTTPSPSGTELVGTHWILSDSTDLGVPTTGISVTAEFQGARMTGTSGCNTYTAPYRAKESALTIGPEIAGTLMACEHAPTAVEQAYLARLPQVESYKITGKTLTLLGGNGKALLVYDASHGASAIVGKWTATGYHTGNAIQSVVAGSTLTADFENTQVSGNGGCNSFSGPYEVTGSKITMGPFRSTMMACTDPELQSQEQHYFAALELARTYQVTATSLQLFRADGGIAATFEPTPITR